jgi:hypothetical protein
VNSRRLLKRDCFVGLLIIPAFLIISANAFAAPEWRGEDGSTFQQWSFSTPDRVNVAPDTTGLNNQYGDPFVWVGDRAVWNDNIGAWAMVTDEMDIFIPNNPQLQPRKEMQIEIVWSQGGQGFLPKRPLISVFPEYEDGSVVFPDISILEEGSIPGTPLFKTIFGVDIVPNPISEWIIIKGDIVIDHIAVDTYCIPEPATIGLVIGGAFMALRRKK